MHSRALPPEADVVAPDGSLVRVLATGERGSMAHFELAAGHVARAVRHRRVEELWFVVSGEGAMWQEGEEAPLPLVAGVSVLVPPRTAFQFRSHGPGPLTVVGVTMPPWPGEDEAEVVEGLWAPDLG
jgi:mannose-6-phosphate isomerase-like protein (cupin superfamily)